MTLFRFPVRAVLVAVFFLAVIATATPSLAENSSAMIAPTNDELTPLVSAGDVECFEDAVTCSVTVTLDIASDVDVMVDYATSDGSATGDEDYAADSGTVTILAGNLTAQIPFVLTADNKFEVDQFFTFTLSSPVNADIEAGEDTGMVTVLNDDNRPTVNISDLDQAEGSSAIPSATTIYNFTVSLSNPSDEVVQVSIATADDTAVAPSDYVALASSTLNFAPEATSQVYTTAAYADQAYESDEQFSMVLSAPVNGTLGDALGLGIIRNDDAQPVLTLSGESKPEGNSGTTAFTATFTLTGLTNLPVMFDYTTVAGSAKPIDSDYTTISGSHTLNAGETSFTVDVLVGGDTKFERDEAFYVELTDLTNAASNVPMATMTVQNDDAAPMVSVSNATCAENDVSCTFSITIPAPSGIDVRVDYAASDGTAHAGSDYTATSGTFIIPMGHVGGTVHVPVGVHDNNTYEGDETFTFTLGNPIDSTLGTAVGVGTITENDPMPSLSFADIQVDEGNSGTTSADFVFHLSAAADLPITVDVITEDGTALEDNDYTAHNGQFVIPAGQTTHTETVTVLTDGLAEYDETFTLRVTQVVNAVLNSDDTAIATIQNDDSMQISISDCTTTEGASCSFTVTVNVPALEDIDIPYTLNDLTSEADDFNHTGGMVTILQGETTAAITVNTTADTDYEFEDIFSVTLTDPTNADVLDGVGVGTIPNDDPRPTLTATVTTLSQNEGNSGATAFNYPLTLSAKSDEVITVHAQGSDGTALVSDNDYAALDSTITFAAGVTTQTVTVNVTGDTKLESDETFSVALSDAVNTTINAGSESLSGTILNDDGQPTVNIADLTLAEGTSQTVNATTAFDFTISLTNPSAQEITVEAATSHNGQADSADYIGVPPTIVTFPVGTTTQTFTVLIYADTILEDDETFVVSLSSPVNVTLGDDSAVGLITNDDAIPTLSISDQTFAEGNNGGLHPVNLTVSLSNPSENVIGFTFDTGDGTALESDGDFINIVVGSYSIPAGQSSFAVPVSVGGDFKYELDEVFTGQLSSISNAQMGTLTALYTVTNDDAVPSLHVMTGNCAEADTDTTCQITVFLSNPTYQTVTAIFATSDGTAHAPNDYIAVVSEAVTIPTGSEQVTAPVTIMGDNIYEQAQTFNALLSEVVNADNGVLTAVITITDDDDAPTLAFQNATVAVNEGDSGTTDLTFTLVQDAASEVTTSFNLALSNLTAEIGTDYNALGVSSGTIPVGSTTAAVTITLNGDTDYEPNETFQLTVSSIVNATPVSLTATGQITNDDLQPFINVTTGAVTERDAGQTSTCVLTLSLTNRSTQTVGVTVVTQNGTATAGGLYPDYTSFIQQVEFPPLTSGPIELNVEVLGDILYEGTTPETIQIVLGGQDHARGVQTGVTCNITENDVQPTVSITGASAAEGDTAGENSMPLALTLSGPSVETITAFISTSDGTNGTPATLADADYVALSSTQVVFNPLEMNKSGAVSITGDHVYETDETFIVNIDNATNATVSGSNNSADYLILNDEALPVLTLIPLASPIIEGTNTGVDRRAAYLATIDLESALPVSFTWEVFGGTAASSGAFADFSPASQSNVTFAPGVTTLVIGPLLTQDTIHELSETLSLRLVNVSGATPSPAVPSGTISITDDDPVPTLSVNPVIVGEGNSAKQAVRFALSNPTYQTVTFTAQTTQGTATLADNDFSALTSLNPATGLPFEIPPFATGVDSLIITGDTIVELDETFTATITAAGNASVPVSAFTVTIQNDDAVPQIGVGAVSIAEGAPSTTAEVTVPVTLNRQSDAIVTANICATDGTATAAGNDYTQECKSVTFPSRDTSESVTFTVNGDDIYEKLSNGTIDPHFVVSVTSPTNGSISPSNGSAHITITDDDPIPTLTLSTLTTSVTEGTGGAPNTVGFQASLSNPTEQVVSLTYETFDTDTEGAADYATASGAILTIPANSLSVGFTVNIVADDIDEPESETFGVRFTAQTNASATLPLSTTAIITDDDDAPIISITGDTQSEGGILTVGLSLSRQSESAVTVTLNTADGTAAAATDYTAVVNQVVTFAAGTTSQSITIATAQDILREADESFTITMSAPTNATLNATPSATLNIINEDTTVALELVNNPSFEGKVLLPWKLGKVSGADKILCGTTAGPGLKSYDGLCAFQFAGNAGPKAQLQGIFEKVDIEAALGAAPNDVGTEDVLRITFAYRAKVAANKPSLRVLAFTSTSLKPKLLDQNLPIVSDWGVYTVDVPLTGGVSFNSLRVMFIDKSVSGKWMLDDISVIYIDNTPSIRSDALALPPALDGFRGGN